MDELIKVSKLTKYFKVKEKQGFLRDLFIPQYKLIKAVDDISFSINKGEIVGFIGPNGAGKTTTIKMLVGILYPTSGELNIAGYVPFRDRTNYLKKVGIVFGQRRSFWPELTVMDNLDLISSFYNITKKDFNERLAELNKVIKIDDFANQPFRKLSLGQQMRAELVSSLIYKPEILFLDEPTIGMDILSKFNYINLLKELNKKEKITILLTSHDLNEIEDLCKRVIIINKGKILFDGLLKNIHSQELLITYEENSVVKTKRVTKAEAKELLQKIDLESVTIHEVPLEDTIKKFYE